MADQGMELSGLVESLVRPLVDHEEDLEVFSTFEDGVESIEIRVNEEDTGKIIGRQGRVIKSIRSIARAAASRNNMSVEVEIID